jgi:fimbrial isopeptide formation D2 family protein/LPXTG-motif cell wall-anchored protein
MKGFKKLLTGILAATLIMGSSLTSSAATITINRDDSWKPTSELQEGESNDATYTYYKILDAEIVESATVAEDGSNSGGTAVYTISGDNAADKVAKLPSIFTSSLASDGKYYVTLADASTSASDIASELDAMVTANPTLFPGTAVTSHDNPVVIDNLDTGYYFIKASNGTELAVQTLDNVEIKEKNDYPKIDKKQKKENGATYVDDSVVGQIGKNIDYEITVTVPADANKDIIVVDEMSNGLKYDATKGLTVKNGENDVAYTLDSSSDSGWQITFTPDNYANYKGQDIVITYSATVTDAALSDTDRDNKATLKYDNNNYVLVDKVDYVTWYTGIVKVDGADTTKKLEGVKFTLACNDEAFNVTKIGDYYVPGGDSNEVVTDANGLIIIRGLDNEDQVFVLTETETQEGYNLLAGPKKLTLVQETTGTTAVATDGFDQVENNKGATLPSTGGIGTTIFYIVGGLLIVAAAVFFVVRRKGDAE